MLLLVFSIYIPLELSFRHFYNIPVFGDQYSNNFKDESADGIDFMDYRSIRYYEIFERSSNRILRYIPKAGFQKGPISINSHGFRDREYTEAKPAGVIRIAVMGDSVVWGHRVAQDETFAKQLEKILREKKSGSIEVMNFGVAGYSLQQEVEFFFEKAKQFDIDYVILGLSINDYKYSSAAGDFLRQNDHISIFRKSYLLSYLQEVSLRILNDRFGLPMRYLQTLVDIPYELLRLQNEFPRDQKNLIVIFPLLHQFEKYPRAVVHRLYRDGAKGLNYEILDLLTFYQQFDPKELKLSPRDFVHPNEKGHRIAAEAVAKHIIDNQVIEKLRSQ